MLSAYDSQLRNFEPTGITSKTKPCIDHMMSQNDMLTKTIKTSISGHYSVLAKFPETGRQKKTTVQIVRGKFENI